MKQSAIIRGKEVILQRWVEHSVELLNTKYTRAIIVLLYQPRMIGEYGAFGGM
jgi:hypothetical protein